MKKIFLIALSFILPFKIMAQVKISTSQLVGTKWERIEPVSKWETNRAMFSEKRFSDTSYNELLNNSITRSLEYYITDEIPVKNKFTRTNVGKERKGKYIVLYYPKIKEVDYLTVISLTDTELILFHKAKPNAIPAIDVYLKYKKIE